MSGKTKIEWTETTWNPITGCTKITDGCKNCYAFTMAKRLVAMKNVRYKNGFNVTVHRDLFDAPLKWKKPRMIFVNSMSDLFHKDVPDEVILELFNVMNKASWHKFQVLTKRSDRLESLAKRITWSENIWLGVTVEANKYVSRIDHLRETDAHIKFISFEPLIDEVKHVDLSGIDWAIVGGESGYGARPIKEEWVRNLMQNCRDFDVSFFFKQWGGVNKKKAGRELDGRVYSEYPA